MQQGSAHARVRRLRTVGPQSRNQESFCATSITSTASGSCFRAFPTCRERESASSSAYSPCSTSPLGHRKVTSRSRRQARLQP